MNALDVSGLTKIYSGKVKAVDSIEFSVKEGEIFGLLGPNGAGKTTTIKMVVTLSKPTAGKISVFGVDVLRFPDEAREIIGYVPQTISVDGDLTGYENLLIFSKLSYVSKNDRNERIKFALEYMGLTDKADMLVKHYSGGMMRRLEIAQALVNRPRLLILDEPSIGLDPASKRLMWEYLRKMNREFGTTILITTHDMSEAEILCDKIAIMNAGKIAVIGPPAELKESVGNEIIIAELQNYEGKKLDISDEIGKVIGFEDSRIKIAVREAEKKIPVLVEKMASIGVKVNSISYSRPTMDDVFLKYAKVSFEQGEAYSQARATRRLIVRRSR